MLFNWYDILKAIGLSTVDEGSWVMRVTGVDKTKTDASAFQGHMVPGAHKDIEIDSPDGLYLVQYTLYGRQAHDHSKIDYNYPVAYAAALILIKQDSEDCLQMVGHVTGREWAAKLRDIAADALDVQHNPLAGFSLDELKDELKRRGVELEKRQVWGKPKNPNMMAR